MINYYQDSERPKRAIIALHGWTGDEHSMVPLAKSIMLQDAKWYIPRAPYKDDVGKGFTWFSGNDETGWQYEKTFELTSELIKQVLHDGFSPPDIYLIGFSMGASLCYYVALRLDFPIGGIIPIAGMIRNPERLFAHATSTSRETPILILHGTEDDIVPIQLGQDAFDLLKNKGFNVSIETYAAKHKIPVVAYDLISDFILNKKVCINE